MKWILRLLSFVFFLCFMAAGVIFYIGSTYKKPFENTQEKTIFIEQGSSLTQIVKILHDERLISPLMQTMMPYLLKFKHQAHLLKAGEYQIPAGSSAENIVSILMKGDSILHKMTFVEGKTTAFYLKQIQENPILSGDITLAPLEGSLSPDTYLFMRHMKRDDLIKKMQGKMQQDILDAWTKKPENFILKTPEELVILASIVEKETGIATERERVAGVFLNRLYKGMKLQSDPTIIYGITNGQMELMRSIYQTDIMRPTAYNTYHIDALPPTPICNPSKASLMAVVNAPNTKDIFFVADGTGGHAFAETLKQHNDNVARWRAIEAEKQNQPVIPQKRWIDAK